MSIQYLQIQVNMSIALPRSNDHVYICFFVNIEIKTSGWHIQQSGAVLKTIRYKLVLLLMSSFIFLHFYCIIFSHVSFKHDWKAVLTFIQSVHQMGHYQTRNAYARCH